MLFICLSFRFPVYSRGNGIPDTDGTNPDLRRSTVGEGERSKLRNYPFRVSVAAVVAQLAVRNIHETALDILDRVTYSVIGGSPVRMK